VRASAERIRSIFLVTVPALMFRPSHCRLFPPIEEEEGNGDAAQQEGGVVKNGVIVRKKH
jgi:hypothetical protein